MNDFVIEIKHYIWLYKIMFNWEIRNIETVLDGSLDETGFFFIR